MSEHAIEGRDLGSRVEDLLSQGQWMRDFCRRLVGPDAADDLVQDTWLVALRRPPREERPGSARAWLAAVARNLARDRSRREGRRRRREHAAARPESAPDELELVQRTEVAHLVAGEMLELSEPYRTTLLLRYVEGLSHGQVAERLGVPEATVRTRVSRGLQDVRRRLDARSGGDRERWLLALLPLTLPERRSLLPLLAAGLLVGTAALTWSITTTAPAAGVPARLVAPGAPEPRALALERPERRGSARLAEQAPPVPAPPAEPPDARALLAPRVLWFHPGGGLGAPLVVGRRLVHAGQRLELIDAEDGSTLWSRQETVPGYWTTPLAHVGDRVLAVHSIGGAAALDLEDGTALWSRSFEELDATPHGGRVAAGEDGPLLVLATHDGLVALDVRDGREVWRRSLGGEVQHAPALSGGLVFAGTRGGTFACVEAATGAVRWRAEGGGEYGWTEPVVADGVVYVGDRGVGSSMQRSDAGRPLSQVRGDRGGAVSAFRVEHGERLWDRVFGATGLARPCVDDDLLWLGYGRVVLPLDRRTGEPLGERRVPTGQNPFGSPGVLDGQLVFGNLDGHLYAHDAADGSLLWRVGPEDGTQVGDWVAAHGRLYVATGRGLVALEDPPGALPLPAGSEVEFPAPPAAAPPPATGAPLFTSAFELAADWIAVLAPERLTDRERPGRGDAPAGEAARDAALSELASALGGEDPTRRRAALLALARCADVQGAAELRPAVLAAYPLLAERQRVQALHALAALGRGPGDLERLHELWERIPRAERAELVGLLARLSDGVLEDRSAQLVLELLEDVDGRTFGALGSGLWGTRTSDELAERLVELARSGDLDLRRSVVYHALSTLEHKQDAVVDLLLETVAGTDLESAQRALWGLGSGLREGQRERVVERLLAIGPALHPYAAQHLRTVVERHGTPEQVERLPR